MLGSRDFVIAIDLDQPAVEQRVDVRSEEQAIGHVNGMIAEVWADLGRFEHILYGATCDRAALTAGVHEGVAKGRLALAQGRHPRRRGTVGHGSGKKHGVELTRVRELVAAIQMVDKIDGTVDLSKPLRAELANIK